MSPVSPFKDTARNSPIALATSSNSRGMIDLLNGIGGNPALQAARRLIEETRPIVICTGFAVGGQPETDGPPGAIALIDALAALGKRVHLASWSAALRIIESVRSDIAFIPVPRPHEAPVIARHDMALVTAEACGRCADGSYRNMRGEDISAQSPLFEDMFGTEALVSFGDGGNEFGMGSAPGWFFEQWHVMRPVSTARTLVPADTSNYGVYAVITEMSRLTARALLPDPDRHAGLIAALVKAGCVDGFSGRREAAVDGLSLTQTHALLTALQASLLRHKS